MTHLAEKQKIRKMMVLIIVIIVLSKTNAIKCRQCHIKFGTLEDAEERCQKEGKEISCSGGSCISITRYTVKDNKFYVHMRSCKSNCTDGWEKEGDGSTTVRYNKCCTSDLCNGGRNVTGTSSPGDFDTSSNPTTSSNLSTSSHPTTARHPATSSNPSTSSNPNTPSNATTSSNAASQNERVPPSTASINRMSGFPPLVTFWAMISPYFHRFVATLNM